MEIDVSKQNIPSVLAIQWHKHTQQPLLQHVLKRIRDTSEVNKLSYNKSQESNVKWYLECQKYNSLKYTAAEFAEEMTWGRT